MSESNLELVLRKTRTPSITLLRDFLDSPQKRYVFGITPYAAGIISAIQIRGVIDDFSSEAVFHGVPVLRTNEAPADAIVVTTTLGRPHTARRALQNAGLCNVDYFAFHRFSGLNLPPARFWSGAAEDVLINQAQLEWIRSLLADSLSVEIFDRIISFRKSANISEIDRFFDNQDHQYFESFLSLKSRDEAFVDIGSYDGKTTKEFIKRCPEFNAAYIFEPDPNNFKYVKNLFSADPRIACYSCGLGDEEKIVKFDSSGSTSSITTSGKIQVALKTLDSFALPNVTFMKIDVEGSELPVLRGARELLSRQQPRLAIAVYHRPSDIWQIPRTIMSIHAGYDIFLRHYTEGVTETVMFFLPKK